MRFFMKLKYLGTAAAEGWPALFCKCEYCENARKLGNKDIRTRSQSLINDDLLIDFPADTYMHAVTNNLDFSAIKYCFVTHSHLDHFSPSDLFLRNTDFYAHNMTTPMMTVYGNGDVMDKLKKTIKLFGDDEAYPLIETEEIKAYKTVFVGKYSITPLPANHKHNENAFVYLIESNEGNILYLHDTGLLYDEVYDYLQKRAVSVGLISYDCTYVILESAGGHMGLDSVPYVRKRLEEIGVANEKTVHIVNHFSHNGKLTHSELCDESEKIGFLCAYDGMEVTVPMV